MTAYWDTANVKGLPQAMIVKETVDGKFVERFVRSDYEDPYTKEFKEYYEMCRNGKSLKTMVADAKKDFEIMSMIMKTGNRVA